MMEIQAVARTCVCYHPLTDKSVNYRMHIDPEGFVIKVEMEKKTKKKLVREQLKLVESEDTE